ncbi:hypothetical protein PHMEG_0007837 [Phytophthora megakarya]|uniref:Integrase catalytic domain-containing protein n=1 Tax=Phytophthora megakarya TaxID=4795 RepID=A0A225WKN7_9STRA|nr:hypothetical protein PHMEG_0007837 [Phytophthora megakarya]
MLHNGVTIDFTSCEMKWFDDENKKVVPFRCVVSSDQQERAARVRLVMTQQVQMMTCRNVEVAVVVPERTEGLFMPAFGVAPHLLLVPTVMKVPSVKVAVPVMNVLEHTKKLPVRDKLDAWSPATVDMKVSNPDQGELTNEDEIDIGQMSTENKDLLMQLLRNFPNLLETRSVHARQEQQIINTEVKKMLKDGVIEKSIGEWGFPVVIVRKKDGSAQDTMVQTLKERGRYGKREVELMVGIVGTPAGDAWCCRLFSGYLRKEFSGLLVARYEETSGEGSDRWAIDVAGPLPVTNSGNRYVAAVKFATRYAVVDTVPNHIAKDVVRFIMEKVVLVYGHMRELVKDGTPELHGQVIDALVDLLQAKQLTSMPYRPAPLGLMETFHRSWKNMVAVYVAEAQNDWDHWVHCATYAYNGARHSESGVTQMGAFANYHRDLAKHMEIATRAAKEATVFDSGDLTWVFSLPKGKGITKLAHQWVGPADIDGDAGFDNWRVVREDTGEHMVVHSRFLVTSHCPSDSLGHMAERILGELAAGDGNEAMRNGEDEHDDTSEVRRDVTTRVNGTETMQEQQSTVGRRNDARVVATLPAAPTVIGEDGASRIAGSPTTRKLSGMTVQPGTLVPYVPRKQKCEAGTIAEEGDEQPDKRWRQDAAAASEVEVRNHQRQTRTFESSLARSLHAESEQKVEQVEALASKTAEYLQQQYDNQVELNSRQAALSAQLEEQQKALSVQYELMREAAETPLGVVARRAGKTGREPEGDETMMGSDAGETKHEPSITVATGSNMPVPPVYRGSTKKEKKAFIDSYLIYKRRVTALNLGSHGRIGKPESEITEEDWKAYFLAARRPEVQDHARLAQAMRSLSMNTTLPDAESRVMKLLTDFNKILDAQDMDDFPMEEPKMAVEFLCAALKPPALKRAITTELKRRIDKVTKKSIKVFLEWLKSRVSAFLIFESSIQQTSGGNLTAQPSLKPTNLQPTSRKQSQFSSKRGTASGQPGTSSSAPTSAATKTADNAKPPVTGKPLSSGQTRGLPAGMGDVLLSESVMERLGYNAQALLDKARVESGVYDMDDDVAMTGCQELLLFLTDMGIFTPIRVLMGGSDSMAYCQATVQEMFEEFLYNGLLSWLDDLLGYAKSEEGLLKLLRGVLKITALQQLSTPATGQDLQQFVCALGWMRMSIPGHNKLTQPLVDLMEVVYEAAGGRTRRKVTQVQLVDVGWSAVHNDCLQICKQALGNAIELAHVKLDYRLSVFTDAVDSHWGAAITQVPADHMTRMLSEQHHEPLMILSGTFSGSAQSWAIVEKEAYAIIATCQRADYLLHRPGRFMLYTDHRNLRFIFNPESVLNSVPKYTADKLQRKTLLLMAYHYNICDIAGDENVWADLLSRWGSALHKICAIRLVPYEYSPTLNEDFIWPTDFYVLKVVQFGFQQTQDHYSFACDEKYILVIKDDASKFVWFFSVADATAETTYVRLMEWFATFGVCLAWVSDQGTHFKNEVIKALQHALGAHHHFRKRQHSGTIIHLLKSVSTPSSFQISLACCN